MLEIKINESENAARIIVVGVGGAGNNAVNRMSLSASIQISRHCSSARLLLLCRSERS